MAFDSESMKLKVLEQAQVAPPPGSVSATSLPLTYLDVVWLVFPPVKRLFFFQFHHPKHHFTQTVLPNLKHSLSLALQRFYPFAGKLSRPADLQLKEPKILYADGDSLSLTVAESEADFDQLVGHQPHNFRDFDPLVPALVSKSDLLSPLMALQVTLFPNSGICIGITVSHVVADGKITTHFIKQWASICRFGSGDDQTSLVSESLPFYDKSVIKDPKGLCKIYLNNLGEMERIVKSFRVAEPVDKFRGTFVMGWADIERLKKWVIRKMKAKRSSTSSSPDSFHLSSFVLVCSFVWVCLIKSGRSDEVVRDAEKDKEIFTFAVDCRNRLDPPVPEFYFGNCLSACFTEAKTSDLVGEDGIAVAAEAMGSAIQSMKMRENMEIKEDSFNTEAFDSSSAMPSGRVVSVAGSPRFKVYKTDFGWGRPKKVEIVSIEDSGAISLCESGDGGGIEVGLVLSKPEMDAFVSLFADALVALA